MPGVARSGLADVVAVCDLDSLRLARARGTVEKLYRDPIGSPSPSLSSSATTANCSHARISML